MRSEIKIPTLLGLGIIVAGIIAGVFLLTTNQIFQSKAAPSTAPKNIQITNTTDTQASISWKTDEPASGFVQAGISSSLGFSFRDERDQNLPQKHILHFATLTKLTPNTTYFYKITSDAVTYPTNSYYFFKTAPKGESNNYSALIGQVVSSDQQPISEALVTLVIDGAQNLSTVTKVAGNFILPLANIRTQNLEKNFTFPETSSSAKLTISDGVTKSEIKISLPPTSKPLPVIILGKNQDLTINESSPAANLNLSLATPSVTPSSKVKPTIKPTLKPTLRGDLSNDGLVNSLDRVVLVQNYGKNPKIKTADLNSDGIVDQKDLDILTQIILKIKP